MKYQLFLYIMCYYILSAESHMRPVENQLFDALFRNYTKSILPRTNDTDVIQISVQINLIGLDNIDEIQGSMDVLASIITEWTDISLQWNPDDYQGATKLVVPAECVWLPDIVLSNSASTFYEWSYKRDFHVRISNSGKIRWSFGGIFSTNCDMVLAKYPFDTQNCSLDIESWLYKIDAVDMDFADQVAIDLSMFQTDPLWELIGTSTESRLKYNKQFRSLLFTLTWKRKHLYYFINVLGPTLVLMIFSLGVFWLPEESGEKISLAVVVVLALTVFQIIIMENTPINSDVVPEITQLILLTLCLSTASLLTAMLVVYLSDKGSHTKKRPPLWLRKLCLLYLAKLFCMSDIYSHNEESDFTSEDRILNSRENKVCSDHLNEKVLYIDPRHSKVTVGVSSGGTKHPKETYQGDQNNKINKIKVEREIKNKQYSDKTKTKYSSQSKKMVHTIQGIFASNQNFNLWYKDIQTIRDILNNFMIQSDKKSKSDQIKGEWKRIAKVIDRTLFWISVVLLIVLVTYIVIHINY